MKYFIYILTLFFVFGCTASRPEKNTIVIKGSTTMQPLVERLAMEYMTINPNTAIYVEGVTTTAGIQALLNGQIDISMASRELKPEERRLLAAYYKTVGMYYLVAKDALTIYVNQDNPVSNLSIDQVRSIFTGKAKLWKKFGGDESEIIIASRLPNSGTYYHLQEYILRDEQFSKEAKIFHTVDEVINFVNSNKSAIGYGGMHDSVGVRHLQIEGVYPDINNSRNDSYPFTRYLFFFTTNTARGPVKDFIDWVLTAEGQRIIDDEGFISLWDVNAKR